MKKQLVAGTVVFVIGFGIGLGLTYLLLAKTPKSEAAQSPTIVSPSEEASVETGEVPPKTDAQAPSPSTEPVKRPAEEEVKPAQVAATQTPPAPEPKPDNPIVKADEPVAKPPEEKLPEAPPAPPEEDSKIKSPGKWWVGLKGKTCKLELGNARALVVRQGGLKDGDIVDWIARFGRNPRIGLIAQTDNLEVLVHGVGVSNSGIPTAAMITFEKQGRKTTGIVALHTQGLKVSLKAIE